MPHRPPRMDFELQSNDHFSSCAPRVDIRRARDGRMTGGANGGRGGARVADQLRHVSSLMARQPGQPTRAGRSRCARRLPLPLPLTWLPPCAFVGRAACRQLLTRLGLVTFHQLCSTLIPRPSLDRQASFIKPQGAVPRPSVRFIPPSSFRPCVLLASHPPLNAPAVSAAKRPVQQRAGQMAAEATRAALAHGRGIMQRQAAAQERACRG